jgi:hypothetical protein
MSMQCGFLSNISLTCWDPITHGYSFISHNSGILSSTTTKTLESVAEFVTNSDILAFEADLKNILRGFKASVYNCCGTPDLIPYSINFFSYED